MSNLTTETLRKAVELADGFYLHKESSQFTYDAITMWWDIDSPPQYILDALAAALVRLTDGLGVEVWPRNRTSYYVMSVDGPDRTENTINAIVEFADKHPEVFQEMEDE